MTDRNTTIAGLGAALALFGTALVEILDDGWQLADVGLLIAAVGVALTGYLAADRSRKRREQPQEQ